MLHVIKLGIKAKISLQTLYFVLIRYLDLQILCHQSHLDAYMEDSRFLNKLGPLKFNNLWYSVK